MSGEHEKSLKIFEKWIKENSTITELNFNNISVDCQLNFNDLLQAKDFHNLLKNNTDFFEKITTVNINGPECISIESTQGIELLFEATKNVTTLLIFNYYPQSINEEVIIDLKITGLSSINIKGFEMGTIEDFLANHPNLETINTDVYLTPEAFSYMNNVVTLNLKGGGLEDDSMELLATELLKLKDGDTDCLFPKLEYLNITELISLDDQAYTNYYGEYLLPVIRAVENAHTGITIEYDMVANEKKNDTAIAIKKLETFAKKKLSLSGLSKPVKSFLSRIQNSPYWENDNLFEKYIAPTLIKMLKEARVGFTANGIITTRESTVFTDIKESQKGCATNTTGTILAYYSLEKCNNFIEKIKTENTSITNEEIMNLVIANKILITDITPIILTDYINEQINNKTISGDRSELIAAALNILAGNLFLYKEEEYKVTNPITLPSSISSYNFTLSDLQLTKIFDNFLIYSQEETLYAALNEGKLKQLISTYLEQFIPLDNKTTWAKNFMQNSFTDDFKGLLSYSYDNQHLNLLIHDIYNGKVINNIVANNEAEYVTHVQEYLRRQVEKDNEKTEDGLLSKKRDFDKPLEKDEFLVNNKKQNFKVDECLNYKLDNKNKAKITDHPPTLDELQTKIQNEGLDAYAFEPTTSMFDYKNSSHEDIVTKIQNTIMNFLYSSDHQHINNFICLLPDNYSISEKGVFSGAHYICILKTENSYTIFDPLTILCANNKLYHLIQDVKRKLMFICSYGTQDVLDANTCAENCINYIKSKSSELKK
jgi:hypothetical protein